jgi:T-complex protein 1 subunit delta
VEISKAQDVEAGDGTTSVTVLAGSLLEKCEELMNKGIHPSVISDSWLEASEKAVEILEKVAIPVPLSDRNTLIKSATTSLNSKIVSQHSSILAPLAVDAVLHVVDEKNSVNVDLNDIKVVTKLGGTVDDTKLVNGLIFPLKASHAAGGPTQVTNANIALIQFQLSAPKSDMENSVIVSDYQQMDRILKEERKYILKMVQKISKAGCNVLLIQKSILRDAVNDISLHYLAKKGIMVVTDIERSDVEFICKTLGCVPIAHEDSFTPEKMGFAENVEEVSTNDGKIIQITGVKNPGKTISVFVRGSNRLVLDEADRSVHDALCVVRCLVKQKYLIVGGGAPEIELSLQLSKYADSVEGLRSVCMKAFAEAFEVIPYTLAENSGLHPISIVTELRKRHSEGETYAGINVRTGSISDLRQENVLQPLLVTTSAIKLASECVRMLLKIDDIVAVR